jgi:hypothetical protein
VRLLGGSSIGPACDAGASVAGASAAASTLPPLAAGQLGPAAAGTVFLLATAGTVFLLATAFSVDRSATEAAEVTLGFVCPPAWGAAVCAGGTPPALAVLLDASTCLFDVARAQAVHNYSDRRQSPRGAPTLSARATEGVHQMRRVKGTSRGQRRSIFK